MMITLEFLDKVITTLKNDYDLKIEMLSTKIDALSARIQILESLVACDLKRIFLGKKTPFFINCTLYLVI